MSEKEISLSDIDLDALVRDAARDASNHGTITYLVENGAPIAAIVGASMPSDLAWVEDQLDEKEAEIG